MHRLRTTFKRSRTPTGAEMKAQSSLEVPKQVRSASFDEMQLKAKWQQDLLLQNNDSNSVAFLKVPQYVNKRSKSVDSGGSDESSSYLEVPRRFQRRRSSGTKTPVCIHCVCVEEYERLKNDLGCNDECKSSSFTEDDLTSSDDDDSFNNYPPTIGSPEPIPVPPLPCNITVTLSPTIERQVEYPSALLTIENISSEDIPASPGRRKSIQRQEAFFTEPTGNSLENVSDVTSDVPSEGTSEGAFSEGDISTIPQKLIISDIYLAVPDLKRDRAASVDSCFSKVSSQGKAEEINSLTNLEVPTNSLRSRSVDIVLPTDNHSRYKALSITSAGPDTKVTPVHFQGRTDNNAPGDVVNRSIRCTPDWSEAAVNGDHLWVPTSVSGDFCYVGDADCTKHGSRMKCSACNVIVHLNCIGVLVDRVKFTCKPTFRDVGVRQYREQSTVQHHWVHRRQEKGKCKQCSKSFQSKLSFSSKEIIAISCSWCKASYHNKESCFNVQRIGEECNLGVQQNIIVPPSWIVKLPRRGSFKSSLRKSPKKKGANKKKNKEKDQKEQKTFVIKPIPSTVTPVIVFINPKSGGNQGLKLLQKFQWLLNPRQVFDLTQGGPKMGLELFKKVPNLRILACGGDGTVGWILSVLDQINIVPQPAVGVLPLGTGNDLARALGWGGGYTDEPISKILANIGESDTVLLDRWELIVEKNSDAEANDEGKDNLPLNVVNNYFSLGVDAHIALEFHEAREAHPEKFNSRLRNKMFYGQAGGKDLLKRKWKDLSEFVKLECDGKDLTPKLKDHRVHAIVFLNIPSYGGGTHPWNRSGGTTEPATDDGLIEVVGLTTYQLPLLQAGGHGTCITQCKTANIITSKTIPMQVDGEACKLKPSVIKMSLLNKAVMLAKRRGAKMNTPQATLEQMKINIQKICMNDYEQHHYDKNLLTQAAICIGTIEVSPATDLEQVRTQINKMISESNDFPKLSPDWCFVDSCTAERFFRIDRAQEQLHYVTDIAAESLFILDADTGTVPQTPENETAFPSPSSNHQCPVPEMKVSDENVDSVTENCSKISPQISVTNETDDNKIQIAENTEKVLEIETTNSQTEIEDVRTEIPSPKSEIKDINIENTEIKINGKIEADLFDHISKEESKSNFKSIHEKLFGLSEDVFGYSNLLEKTTDGILKAAKLGDLKTLKELHSQGYSLLSIDSQGQTALHYGARYGHKDIVKYLIANAPSSILNMADNDKGQTALHKAASYKRRSICYMLVAGGASLIIQDHRGATPRLLALAAEDHELAAYLESQEQFQLVSEDLETMV